MVLGAASAYAREAQLVKSMSAQKARGARTRPYLEQQQQQQQQQQQRSRRSSSGEFSADLQHREKERGLSRCLLPSSPAHPLARTSVIAGARENARLAVRENCGREERPRRNAGKHRREWRNRRARRLFQVSLTTSVSQPSRLSNRSSRSRSGRADERCYSPRKVNARAAGKFHGFIDRANFRPGSAIAPWNS